MKDAIICNALFETTEEYYGNIKSQCFNKMVNNLRNQNNQYNNQYNNKVNNQVNIII